MATEVIIAVPLVAAGCTSASPALKALIERSEQHHAHEVVDSRLPPGGVRHPERDGGEWVDVH